jgi:hypothetical protein
LDASTRAVEKSASLVAASAQKLGVPLGDELSAEQAARILEDLAQMEGLVGVVARFVKTRSNIGESTPASSREPVRAAEDERYSRAQLNALLGPALGDAKGLEAIATYAQKIGAGGDTFTRAQALEMLELMAQVEGVLGTVARFAKARLLLKPSA